MQTFTSLRRAARSLGLVTVGVLSTLGALSLSHVGPVQAQSPGVNLAQLVAQVNTLQSTVSSQATTIRALQVKTAPLSVSNDPNAEGTNTLLTIKGVNVQIVDGTGSTASTSGLGNLIIGYNRSGARAAPGDIRTGSHNLILGDANNYQSYGGIVAGVYDTISGPYACVSGGTGNTAGAYAASVSGGSSVTQNDAGGWSGGSYHSP